MKTIYLIRHGNVDYSTQELSLEGIDFAQRLPTIVPLRMDVICSDESKRCQDTIAVFANAVPLTVQVFSKEAFRLGTPLLVCLQTEISAICYRIETINPILKRLGLDQFTHDTRDSAYEFIWKVEVDDRGDLVRGTKLPTGCSKRK